jgi:hypothetical protein
MRSFTPPFHLWKRIAAVIGVTLLLAAAISLITALSIDFRAAAQAQPTPLTIIIPTLTPTVLIEQTATPTRTPTRGGSLIRVQAKIEANIRTAPDLNAQILKKIRPGIFYAVVGKRGKWLQIQFSESPTGLAWVFDEVVEITGGDLSTIPELGVDAVPSPNVATNAAQETAAFITGTPGAPGTATAMQAAATGVRTLAANNSQNSAPGAPLPTFTPPPPFVEATLPARATTITTTTGTLPPIAPIMGLAVLGVAGLFISALRRGR